MSLFLTEDELVELTGYRKKKLQREALGAMEIPFRSRPADGFPLVTRSFLEPLTKAQKRREPRLDLVQ
jgi:hypothetical protein